MNINKIEELEKTLEKTEELDKKLKFYMNCLNSKNQTLEYSTLLSVYNVSIDCFSIKVKVSKIHFGLNVINWIQEDFNCELVNMKILDNETLQLNFLNNKKEVE